MPRVDRGGRVLEFDFPAMRVGVAEYDDGPTGTTVFYFPDGVKAAADVRGGSPGTLNADAVRLGYERRFVSAVVFAGGSWYGLSAATGVANAIKQLKAAQGAHDYIAGVLGGIIYDVGGRRFSRVTPDERLGRAALDSAVPNRFPLGARGAGRFAMQGAHFAQPGSADGYAAWAHSGQGGAFRAVGPTRIAVFTVVNSLGTIVDRAGGVVRCGRNHADAACPPVAALLARPREAVSGGGEDAEAPTGNTTLTIVVTNQKMPFWALQRLAVQVHTSLARAIQPFATSEDGDVLYAVTTDEVENSSLTAQALSAIASELAWDAVLSSVPDIPPAPVALAAGAERDPQAQYTGVYAFPGGGELAVSADNDGLVAQFTGNGRIYFDNGRRYPLTPAGRGMFIVEAPARDVLRFDRTRGAVTGLTLNPGPWGLTAQRRP